MDAKVVWMPVAIEDYEAIINFLFLVWNVEIVNDFDNLIQENIKRIKRNPNAFPIFLGNVRKVIIHKNVTLFYEFKSTTNQIDILSIFDNRQNPNKLTLKST